MDDITCIITLCYFLKLISFCFWCSNSLYIYIYIKGHKEGDTFRYKFINFFIFWTWDNIKLVLRLYVILLQLIKDIYIYIYRPNISNYIDRWWRKQMKLNLSVSLPKIFSTSHEHVSCRFTNPTSSSTWKQLIGMMYRCYKLIFNIFISCSWEF
jgi:hypothetical protein